MIRADVIEMFALLVDGVPDDGGGGRFPQSDKTKPKELYFATCARAGCFRRRDSGSAFCDRHPTRPWKPKPCRKPGCENLCGHWNHYCDDHAPRSRARMAIYRQRQKHLAPATRKR